MNSEISNASTVKGTPALQMNNGSKTSQFGGVASVNDAIALDARFRVYHNCQDNLTIDEFLAQHVLCRDGLPDPPALNTTGFFAAIDPPLSDEAMHDSLISGLTKLVEDFPIGCRPRFQKRDRTRSVNVLHSSHHNRFPETDNTSTRIWNQVMIVSEANQVQDPIDANGLCKPGSPYLRIRAQLLKNALDLLKLHKSSYLFILGIYGPTFRIFRFDRFGVISSIAVDYVTSPQMLRKFLWLLVQRQKDRSEAFSDHRLANVSFTQDLDLETGVKCFTSESLSHSDGHFSRASGVSTTLIRHTKQIYVLKDPFHERTRIGEGYSHVQKMIQDELGDLISEHVSGLTNHTGTCNLALHDSDGEKCGLITKTGQRKEVAAKTRKASHFNRHHIRTLSCFIGRKLTSFESTKQLVMALRDVIVGLVIAHRYGVVHRDVSVTNILLHEHKPGGFLCDFDHTAICISAKSKPELLEEYIIQEMRSRIGTWPFVAVDFLKGHKVYHRLRHNLESVYWVLIWCLLRHTTHNHSRGKGTAQWLFDEPKPYYLCMKKKDWVDDHVLPIPENAPLTKLLADLRPLIYDNIHARPMNKPEMELTRKMLEVINKALVGDWPPNDSSIPYRAPLNASA